MGRRAVTSTLCLLATFLGVVELVSLPEKPQVGILPVLMGVWGPWSVWSACSVTCDSGIRHRTRVCLDMIRPVPIPDPRPVPLSLSKRQVFNCPVGRIGTDTEACTGSCEGPVITRPTNCQCLETQPATCVNEECSPARQLIVSCPCTRLDVGLVIDGSGSISLTEFEDMRQSAQRLLDSLLVGSQGDWVSVLVYSSAVAESYGLEGSRTILNSRLTALRRPGQLTRTDLGISTMAGLLVPGRVRVPKIMVVFTDGQSTNKAATPAAADEAKAEGIAIYAVGIGDNTDPEELRRIASNSGSVLQASSFNDLKVNVVNRLAAAINTNAARLQ